MDEAKQFLEDFLLRHRLTEPGKHVALFEAFAEDEANRKTAEQIIINQNLLMKNWKITERVQAIATQHAVIPNATAGKPYEAILDFEKLGWTDIRDFELGNLEDAGLLFDKASKKISGTPSQSGDLKLSFRFRLNEEAPDALLHEKAIPFIVNPDPKTLWKDVPSPQDAVFYKPETAAIKTALGDRTLIVASKRGRSHANVGSFRDDDFGYAHFADSGWNLVSVADGAGSAPFSREGSHIACETVSAYFTDALTAEQVSRLDGLIENEPAASAGEAPTALKTEACALVSGAAFAAHKAIEAAAVKAEAAIKDFHTTLVFVLFKKYDTGYALLSFSVGDCPAAILNKEATEVTLLHKLDVGAFSGGTRFLTMNEIFQPDSLAARCSFRMVKDFSCLVLMSDGVYDPKFGVEARLEKIDSWNHFLEDLAGENESGSRVDLKPGNETAGEQLLSWMDFWSAGNHDDRTLALVF